VDVEDGTEAPGEPPGEVAQVEVEFQFPSVTAYLVWALAPDKKTKRATIRNIVLKVKALFFIITS
jgi:hypothetical protein